MFQVSEKISQQKRWKLPFSTTPLSFDAPSQGISENISINLISPETNIFAAESMRLSSFNFLWWAPKDAYFLQYSAYRPLKVIQIERAMRLPISH